MNNLVNGYLYPVKRGLRELADRLSSVDMELADKIYIRNAIKQMEEYLEAALNSSKRSNYD